VTFENAIHAGDCLEWLRGLSDQSADLVWTDPPYNAGKDYGPGIDDSLPWPEYWAWVDQWLPECVRVARRGGALFLPQRLVREYWNRLPDAEQVVIRKGAFGSRTGAWRQQYHVVLTTAKPLGEERNLVEGIRLPGEGYYFSEERPDHPGLTAQALTAWAITTLTLPGELVIDPFMGSGTTAIVAERYGRRWAGCELSQRFVDMAWERIGAERDKPKLPLATTGVFDEDTEPEVAQRSLVLGEGA